MMGQVHGVGYRPFIYRLANRCGVSGFVRNDDRGVTIQVQGSAAQLERFSRALDAERPPLALVEQTIVENLPATGEWADGQFEIIHSDPAAGDGASAVARVGVTVDSALCPACLAELLDRADRRYGYGLITCTNCGPRYTIIDRVPYDRPNTTMRGFPLCEACEAEYTAPADRRYHAQPIACHDCGPVVELVDPTGSVIDGDPIAAAVDMLRGGRVVAIKGLGGFHLACRADDERAVKRLRTDKARQDGKPFALMCRSVEAARALVRLSEHGLSALTSPAAPIVLGPIKDSAGVAPSVAPNNHRLGVMLAYTPMQHLLFEALGPVALALVMTSANPSGEPLTIDNDEALARLRGLCDAMLRHDRPIRRRVDDSVVLDRQSGVLPMRRARGFVPTANVLPAGDMTHGLCVGGELKNTIALVRDGRATLSQHLGDLSYTPVFDHFRQTIDDLLDLFDIRPRWIAHDLHPMYLGTTHARTLGERWGVPMIGVQHHHAHAASVMAEHGVSEPVLAVVCDGVGYGGDGTSWGGELLLADLIDYQRLAHLKPIDLIGGDAAATDTRRCGLSLLRQAYGDDFADHPMAWALWPEADERLMLTGMLERGLNCSPTTALGRYFDGIAAVLGLSERNQFEAQAAMRLESEASAYKGALSGSPLFCIEAGRPGAPGTLDLSPLIRAIVEGRLAGGSVAKLAALWHDQLAWAWAEAVDVSAKATGVKQVAPSGGVFCNERLTRGLSERLTRLGYDVLLHQDVPANDGGLALGQAAVASARYERGLIEERAE